jgi:hypothetical protein
VQVDLIDIAARIIPDRATVGKNVVQLHPHVQPEHRLIVDPAELLVHQLKPVLGIVQTDTLRHVRNGLLETLSERARASEAPRQFITDRGQRLCESASRVWGRLTIPGSTRHVRIPVNSKGIRK